MNYVTPIIALALLSPTLLFAASTTQNLDTNATLNPKCSIHGNKIDFGEITPKKSGYINVNSSITTTCTKETSYNIILGSGNSGNMLIRKLMSNNLNNLDGLIYSIYKNADFTSLLGDGSNGTTTLQGVGTGYLQNLVIYSRLPLNQYIKSDYYSDNLTVTINY